MEIIFDVDMCLDVVGYGCDIEMCVDGEVVVDVGVDMQWGVLMVDSSGQYQDEGSILIKMGVGILELIVSGIMQLVVCVEEGILKGDVVDIFFYVSLLWVGDGVMFVIGVDQDIQLIDVIFSGIIDISDGMVLCLIGQDIFVVFNVLLFNGDGMLVNVIDGVMLIGEFNINFEIDSLIYFFNVMVNGNLINMFGVVSL